MSKKNFVSYEQQQAAGLVRTKQKGHRTRADLGMASTPSTSIQRVEPQKITPRFDFTQSAQPYEIMQPYRVTKDEHIDDAKAFLLASGPITILATIAAVFTFKVGLAIPIVSLAMLVVIFSVACVTFGGCWLTNKLISHYGVVMVKVIMDSGIQLFKLFIQYRLLRYEQKERHAYYESVR